MKYRFRKSCFIYPLILALASACASIGNPSGGPRDEEPPRFSRSNPAPGALNFSGQRLDIYFNELVNVKDAFSKVIVSPPPSQTPRVTSQGRRVSVQFADTLLPNTTYTVDFADAIEDNNEQNKLQNFTFTFSTGPTIDSLRISGMVLSSDALEPLQGKLVGVHSNPADSAFRKLRFDRVARTDERGRFTIFGLAPGRYRIFALDDQDNDMKYSTPEEQIAFVDYTLSPSTTFGIATDTIFNLKTGAVDTVMQRRRTVFLPNDILLRSFTSEFRRQYMKKYERLDTTRLYFEFNSASLTPPEFTLVDSPQLNDWYIRQSSPANDTVTLWIKPGRVLSSDTLRVAVKYMRQDSLDRLVPFSDTLRMTFDRKKHERIMAQERKDLEKRLKSHPQDSAKLLRAPSLDVTAATNSAVIPGQSVSLHTATPLRRLDPRAVHLEMKKDTVWQNLAFDGLQMPDSLNPTEFSVSYPWQYDTAYRLRVDSAGMEGIYGPVNIPFSMEFRVSPESDYSSLRFRISGIPDTIPAFVQLLNNDNPVRKAVVKDGVVNFKYLQPGKYYARICLDNNGNGVYDPGDYDLQRQPDLVYYYPKMINLKKNWDKEETWNIYAVAVNMQKPEAILKNRPKAVKGQTTKPTPEEEEEEE